MITKHHIWSAILAVTLFCTASCGNLVEEDDETGTVVVTIESEPEVTTEAPESETETDAITEETDTVTEDPVTTEVPTTETEPPIEPELPDGEPVLKLDDLPPDIPAPRLIHGQIKHPMIHKNNGFNSYFYGIGITGQPYRGPTSDGIQVPYDDCLEAHQQEPRFACRGG